MGKKLFAPSLHMLNQLITIDRGLFGPFVIMRDYLQTPVPMWTNLFVAEIVTLALYRWPLTLVLHDNGAKHFARNPACYVAQKTYTEWAAGGTLEALLFCKRLTMYRGNIYISMKSLYIVEEK